MCDCFIFVFFNQPCLHENFHCHNKLVSKLVLKTSRRVKDHRTHKMKTKGIFGEGGVNCSLVVI